MGGRAERGQDEGGLRRRAAVLATILMLIALTVGSVFGDRGLLYLLAQKQGQRRLAEQVEELRAENQRLAAEISALRADPRSIEKIAREELGLSRPDETIFLIAPEQRGAGR